MDSVIKGFLSAFFLIFFVFISVGMINIALQGRNADSFADSCANKIESANYSESVIQECKDAAESNEYALVVDAGGREKSKSVRSGMLTLTYKVSFPFLGLDKEKTVIKALR